MSSARYGGWERKGEQGGEERLVKDEFEEALTQLLRTCKEA